MIHHHAPAEPRPILDYHRDQPPDPLYQSLCRDWPGMAVFILSELAAGVVVLVLWWCLGATD